ncbi:MAG: hypothetical protein ACW99X_01145 [Candidatus Thorarchaeota archaeon]
MNSKGVAIGVIGIVCVTLLCVMYDFREYEEYNPEEQHTSITILREMSTNRSTSSLNLTDYILFPQYYFESLEIQEVLVEQLTVSMNNSEVIIVFVRSSDFGGIFEGNVTPGTDFVINNLSLFFAFDLLITLIDLSEVFTPANVSIDINLIIDCVFRRPPKHTISGSLLNSDPRMWTFVGVVVLAVSIILLSRKLMN